MHFITFSKGKEKNNSTHFAYRYRYRYRYFSLLLHVLVSSRLQDQQYFCNNLCVGSFVLSAAQLL